MKKNVLIFIGGLLLVILILGIYAMHLLSNGVKKGAETLIKDALNSDKGKNIIEQVKIDLNKNGVKVNELSKDKNDKSKDKDEINKEQALQKIKANNNEYTYNAIGKRDPFVRFDASRKDEKNEERGDTPLENLDIKQLKLTAIMLAGNSPKAVIEDANGKGFFVEKGASIGLNNGVITDILQDKIIITETQVDFTGQKKIRNIEMTLRK